MKTLIKTLLFILSSHFFYPLNAQMMYQDVTNKNLGIGAYGRIGVDWNFENGGAIGRRLNLNNMGSIGGRLEEQDYLELATALHFKPFKKSDSTIINFQARFSVFSRSLSLFGNSTTSSLGGLTFGLPELYVEAKDIKGLPLNAWIGARLYRGPDVHIADHFFFNDHSGQGFGVEYKNTRFSGIFVASTDTSSTLPPSFYLNIATGTPSLSLRGRYVFALEHDIILNEKNAVTLLGEYHNLEDASATDDIPDSLETVLNYPSDFGWVLGARHMLDLPQFGDGSFNQFSIRYGSRIANGGDGGLSRTYLTYGAPNLNTGRFNNAYSLAIVNHLVMNISKIWDFNAYFFYTKSRGAAETLDEAETYFGRTVMNSKEEWAIGFRNTNFITDIFHLLSEMHFSQRKDGTQLPYNVIKFSLSPTLVPTGERSQWARPHLRLVFSLARFNDKTVEDLYSPFLAFAGPRQWGHYFGFKAEWWIW